MNVESLERRELMAAQIDRIQFSPASQNIASDQFIELRGNPGETIRPGTFLVAINSAANSADLGDVHALFDLSNRQLGSNGKLVIVPSDSQYAFEGATNRIVGANGFVGAAGYQADSSATALKTSSQTYLLIESSTAPQLSDDIDSDNDGLPDGRYASWQLLDGVSILTRSENSSAQRSYAPIVFSEQSVGSFLPGSTVVETGFIGTVARKAAGSGYAAADWTAGNAPDLLTAELDVPENSPSGYNLTALQNVERDANDAVTYTMVSQSLPWFQIAANNGVLSVLPTANIDFEGSDRSEVIVRVTDSSGLALSRRIVVQATNRNDPPVLTEPIANQNAAADIPFSLQVPADTFRDQDAGDVLQLAIQSADGTALPQWLTFDPSTRILSGTPPSSALGIYQLQITATDTGRVVTGTNFQVRVSANPYPWHNHLLPADANSDGSVTGLDVLWVINFINTQGAQDVPAGAPPASGLLDVSRDNFVSAIDALLIINTINGQASGEGEWVEQPDTLGFDWSTERQRFRLGSLLILPVFFAVH